MSDNEEVVFDIEEVVFDIEEVVFDIESFADKQAVMDSDKQFAVLAVEPSY